MTILRTILRFVFDAVTAYFVVAAVFYTLFLFFAEWTKFPLPSSRLSKAMLFSIVLLYAAGRYFGILATAKCWDGSYSWSAHHSGTCSWHGGVQDWER